ncbi:MAG: L-dopachrome tautomerase-related protein [Gemmatales bacterium]
MKRTWRPGRMVLAALLMCIAALGLSVWPKQSRWQLPVDMTKEFQHILSVDETRRCFHTRYMDLSSLEPALRGQESPPKPVFELRCYDLDTGKLVWSQPDPSEVVSSSPNLLFAMCQVVLSPDNSQIAYINTIEGKLFLYDIALRQKRSDIHFKDPSLDHFHASYSHRGDWLIAHTSKQILIYDPHTAKLLHQLEIPKEHVTGGGRGAWSLEQDSLVCSADQRYLIMADNFAENILVFDMQNKNLIGESKKMSLPRLINDGKTLVCFPEYFGKDTQARWYSLQESAIVKLSVTTSEPVEGEYVCSNDMHFLTIRTNPSEVRPFWSDWAWLSDSIKVTLAQWSGLLNMQLEASLWNINTGKLEKRYPLAISVVDSLPSSGHRCWLSNDSTQLLLNIGTSISLWDVPPRRPLSSWVTTLSACLFALWLAWPRRMKTTPPVRVAT